MIKQTQNDKPFVVIVPAAGVGKRMLSSCPKQYLEINNQSILTHTTNRLLSHPKITKVIIVLSDEDEYFVQTGLADNANIVRVSGGKERVDSVLNGLNAIDVEKYPWILVHDAARPCVTHDDIDKIIEQCIANNCGGLLAAQVVDTMKQSSKDHSDTVGSTIDRSNLWHAFTPQMYKTVELKLAIEEALEQSLDITDESSAIELAGLPSLLVLGRRDNIKITRPEDLALATFYLDQQKLEQLRLNQ
ncbi:2-C-methyl-D-erythritol 4-phosphate cytidylyltransferase [Candidatus Colwellia aromaticivorans]|uniref:2-C-methyl-D-erythritol 4-phosphate cytidylyltransferase n=1 Tax=Candidatus Colwellia aromaticivorans TaxID=2267621 RepID=UPI001FE4D462|nr:2-C-methyl-D-erythritol 4-phosphate cytidylyltransferase [Candidatus Colwellia aromaticivorans]